MDGEDENSIRVLHQNMLFPLQTIRAETDPEKEIKTSSAVLLAKANLLMEEYFNSKENGWDSEKTGSLDHFVIVELQDVDQ